MTPDEEDAYMEWLAANAELHICNAKELIKHFEARTRLDEFLEKHHGPGLLGTDSTTGGV